MLGYLRRDEVTHEVWDSSELAMPLRRMTTQAMWWTVPPHLTRRLGWPELRMGRPCTPWSTRPSACSRLSRRATAGTSAVSPPHCTRHRPPDDLRP
uniref:hypothetical protein n=1 Tax=Tessaracoccus coleopterorum TaxID=2714950 RepID=UPI001E34E746|nr:hypothetical protein [Tessaracoccus coleopterorum]